MRFAPALLALALPRWALAADVVVYPLLDDTDGDGLTDGEEVADTQTDPLLADTDGDGLTDGEEAAVYGTDPTVADTDGDGLDDGFEVTDAATDPLLADTDGGSVSDGAEVLIEGTDPLDPTDDVPPVDDDADDDGLTDIEETGIYGTDPNVADSDGDGLSDGEEVEETFTDPLATDTDGDGLLDGEEVLVYLTDPNADDTDGDGLSDGEEVETHSTDPNAYDTDGDELADGTEVNTTLTDPTSSDTDGGSVDDGTELLLNDTDPLDGSDDVPIADRDGDGLSDTDETDVYGTNPDVADTDGDGLSDGEEVDMQTDPNNPDTDGGSVNDGDEVAAGTDPLNEDDDISDEIDDTGEPQDTVKGGDDTAEPVETGDSEVSDSDGVDSAPADTGVPGMWQGGGGLSCTSVGTGNGGAGAAALVTVGALLARRRRGQRAVLPFSLREKVPAYARADEGSPPVLNPRPRALTTLLLLALVACKHKPSDTPVDSGDTASPPPVWDEGAAAIDCAPGGDAALLDEALANADIAREDFGYADSEWTIWGDLVDNPFVLSWFLEVHHDPEQVPCFNGQVQSDIDVALATPHPVASAIAAWAQHVDVELTGDPPDDHTDLATLLGRFPDLDEDAASSAAALDPTLAAALSPIVSALADAVDLRATLDAEVEDGGYLTANNLFNQAGGLVIAGRTYTPDVANADELKWFQKWYRDEDGPRAMFAIHARAIAFAIENADLSAFAGGDTSWVVHTAAGALRITGSGDDTHDDSDGATLFHLDLGGNDTWLGTTGATFDKDNPVSVVVDLGGTDTYGYVEVPDPGDQAGTLVSDEGGRQSSGGADISASDIGRQGSGRYGIGILMDLGTESDSYASLRMSQGYGSIGVGVLYDQAGDDVYAGEAGVQGAGIFGLGLLLDGDGNDHYNAWVFSQGFGYVGSGGLLADAGPGADVYWSDPGDNYGGTTLYFAAQLPNGEGSLSFTQGAGFGFRGDSVSVWLAGGLGMLRDGGGDDTYTAGVFAQGTGYWEGTGLLSDADGNDTYDSLYYAQGGAAHFALAALIDGGGDDSHNTNFTPNYMMLGAGHDYSSGVLIDESGNDTLVVPGLALGASNCQGRGVYVDNDGSDTYLVSSNYSTGLGNHSGECEARADYTGSNALFMDSGGDTDTYTWPSDDTTRAPADNSSFGIAWNGTDDEHGGAVDGDGETGFHAR